MNKVFTILSSALLLGLMSCNSSQFEGYTKAETGLHYKFFNHDEAATTAKEGDGISFKYIFKLLSKDSVLVNSSLVSQDGSGITKFIMPATSFLGSVEDALMMMAVGDSASFIVNADSFFLKTNRLKELPPFVKTGDFIQADIKMIEIKTKSELEENQRQQQEELKKLSEMEKPKIDSYIAENKITVKPTASGLYYLETLKGKGPVAKVGDLVTVQYIGKLLDGTEFDSSYGRPDPFKFTLGNNEVIPGWEEALLMMAKGGKAKLILPSSIAYGARNIGPIPPFSPLLFEVELVNIEKAE
jgi:FKBP-type peptidyl-prolyl cis-trans isomerase